MPWLICKGFGVLVLTNCPDALSRLLVAAALRPPFDCAEFMIIPRLTGLAAYSSLWLFCNGYSWKHARTAITAFGRTMNRKQLKHAAGTIGPDGKLIGGQYKKSKPDELRLPKKLIPCWETILSDPTTAIPIFEHEQSYKRAWKNFYNAIWLEQLRDDPQLLKAWDKALSAFSEPEQIQKFKEHYKTEYQFGLSCEQMQAIVEQAFKDALPEVVKCEYSHRPSDIELAHFVDQHCENGFVPINGASLSERLAYYHEAIAEYGSHTEYGSHAGPGKLVPISRVRKIDTARADMLDYCETNKAGLYASYVTTIVSRLNVENDTLASAVSGLCGAALEERSWAYEDACEQLQASMCSMPQSAWEPISEHSATTALLEAHADACEVGVATAPHTDLVVQRLAKS